MDAMGLTGTKKVAILLKVLGADRSSLILQNFQDQEVEVIIKEMIADALAGKFESENSTPLGVGCAIRPVAVCYIEGQRRA